MMFGGRRSAGAVATVAATVVVLGVWAVAVPAKAAELKSKDAVAARVAQTYGVEVLRMREVTVDGRVAYAITVMNPGGNFNAAFQVNTLLADAATGDLMPTLGYRASGYDLSGAAAYESNVDGTAIRRRSFGE